MQKAFRSRLAALAADKATNAITANAISYPDEPGLRKPGSLHFFRIVKEQPKNSETHCEARSWWRFALNSNADPGGANRDRTGDLLLAKQALSQLSYGPGKKIRIWWVWMDSNHRPPPYQDGALTN